MPPDHELVTVEGQVTDLFGHRFALAAGRDKLLADLGPKGAEAVRLGVGDQVKLTGERRPSEIKVHHISVGGREHALHRKEPTPEAGAEERARAAVRDLGFEPVGRAKPHPKHFEILARRGEETKEFHVGFDAAIRKSKDAP